MRTVGIGLAFSLLVAPASCSSEPEVRAEPSSAFPSENLDGPTAYEPTESGPTGPSDLPTTSPGAATGNLTSGEVSFVVSGDVQARATLRLLVTALYSPPPGGIGIVWTGGGDSLSVVGIGGASFTGTQPTSPSLSLTLTAQTTDGLVSFLSLNGECEITIEVAEDGELAGGFTCTDLESGTGEVVDVTASFAAAG